MNYGAIGLFIGHEISHGFDKNSQNFYADGAQWWTEDAKKQFSDRAQCFVEQYKNYRDSETKIKVSRMLINLFISSKFAIYFFLPQKKISHGNQKERLTKISPIMAE